MEVEHGQRGRNGWWADPKIWANVRFYKRNSNNENFRRFKPNGNLEANTNGKIFVNDCQTESTSYAICVKRDDYVEAMELPNQHFGTRKSGPTEPIANGIARISAIGGTRTLTGVELWK